MPSQARKWPKYFDRKTETMRRSHMLRLQEKLLKRQLRYVYANSPFYKEKWKKEGFHPDRIHRIADIVKTSFTEKEELRVAMTTQPPPIGRNQTVPIEKIVRIHASSGSTGVPTMVGLTQRDSDLWTDTAARCFWATGMRPGDIFIHAWNYHMFVGGVADHIAAEKTGACVIPIGIGQSARLVRIAKYAMANGMNATPSYVQYLEKVVRDELNIEPAELGIKKFCLGGEPGVSVGDTRKKISETWGASARELWGMVDIHPIIGAECEYEQGMHLVLQDYVYTELVDENTGEPVPWEEGAKGEMVHTHLNKDANPVVRFRSHDVVKAWTELCECGRTGYRVRIIGRTDDMLKVRGVQVYPTAVKDVLLEVPGMIGNFQIHLNDPGPAYDKLNIVAEYSKNVDNAELENLRRKAEERLGSVLLFGADITLVPEDTLPKFEHKAKYIYKLFAGDKLGFELPRKIA